MNDLAAIEIDDSDAVVAQFGDEQALAREIDRHVVYSAGYIAERNLGFQPQRRPASSARTSRVTDAKCRQAPGGANATFRA